MYYSINWFDLPRAGLVVHLLLLKRSMDIQVNVSLISNVDFVNFCYSVKPKWTPLRPSSCQSTGVIMNCVSRKNSQIFISAELPKIINFNLFFKAKTTHNQFSSVFQRTTWLRSNDSRPYHSQIVIFWTIPVSAGPIQTSENVWLHSFNPFKVGSSAGKEQVSSWSPLNMTPNRSLVSVVQVTR